MLLTLSNIKVWLYRKPIDFRGQIDALVLLVAAHLREDPTSGHVFAFRNRSADKIKLLYCISPQIIAQFHTEHLIYTFPFVLYGIFRYLYLIHSKDRGGSPEKVLFTDLPLLASVVLWGFCCIFIIYRII